MTRFPAKLLLFGEYTILLGSPALSLPFNYFGASLGFIHHETGDLQLQAQVSNDQVRRLYDHFVANSQVFDKFLNLYRHRVEFCKITNHPHYRVRIIDVH